MTLYVLAEFQSRGIGRALFKQVEADANEKGKRLRTWVLKGNKAAAFYEKMGLKLCRSEEKTLGDSLVQELMFSN